MTMRRRMRYAARHPTTASSRSCAPASASLDEAVVNQEQIEAGFDEVRRERTVRAHLDDVLDAAFWRRLNPALTISDDPFARPRRRVQVDAAVVDRAKRQLLGEGYMQTPSLVTDEELVRLRDGIGRLTEAGFP